MKRITFTLPGLNLAGIDFGGNGPGILLLHGLMGRATTWMETASWLTPHFHVVGLDQRGHGLSDQPERCYSREDYVNDIIQVIEKLNLGPMILIGHSMGALNAWVLAARRPDLVKGLVIEDMGASAQGLAMIDEWRDWFAEWPLPFPSLAEVRSFFGQQNPSWADYFMEVFKEKPEGYVPLFSSEQMLQSVEDWARRDFWVELEKIECPALVIHAEKGSFSRQELEKMATRIPQGQFIQATSAGHVIDP